MEDAPIICGLEEFHARTLTAQTAENDKISFLVGTQSLRSMNQVQLLEVDDDTNNVTKHAFNHPDGEIWGLMSAPKSPDLICTVYDSTADHQTNSNASIFRLPICPSASSNQKGIELQKICDLTTKYELKTNSQVHSVIWAPEDDSKMVSVIDCSIFLLDLNATSNVQIVSKATVNEKSTSHLANARWCSHQQASQVSVTFGSDIISWDLRTMEPAWKIPNAHTPLVRNLDFNPNKQYYLASCGDDCSVKVWDIRRPEEPLLTRADHSHWVWCVRFNTSYDQLVVSCSSDQRVILSNLASVGSKPLTVFEDDAKQYTDPKMLDDSILRTYDDHEDSVYAVEWSCADSWTFASLSYDGRVVINKVPKSFKYKQFF